MNNIVFYQLDALLEIISRDRVTATPPHVSVRQQEDTGNGPVLDGGIDLGVAPNVALPDDDNVFHSTEAQSSIALDNSLEPDTIAITSEDAALWATIDKILARSRAERLASSPPANIPSECACETAVSDDCTTEDIDFEGRISVENVQADGNGSIAGHNSETLPGTPCDNSALLDSTSSLLLPLPPSSPVSAHIPQTDIPETVVEPKARMRPRSKRHILLILLCPRLFHRLACGLVPCQHHLLLILLYPRLLHRLVCGLIPCQRLRRIVLMPTNKTRLSLKSRPLFLAGLLY